MPVRYRQVSKTLVSRKSVRVQSSVKPMPARQAPKSQPKRSEKNYRTPAVLTSKRK